MLKLDDDLKTLGPKVHKDENVLKSLNNFPLVFSHLCVFKVTNFSDDSQKLKLFYLLT